MKLTFEDRLFLSQDTLIDIIPNFTYPVIRLLSGNYGPFHPPHRTSVPLWMAMHLRKGGHCTVLLPQWLDIDYLERMLKEEREKPEEFSSIHYFWMEIYSLLTQCAEDDFIQLDKTQLLIQQLKETRHYKIMEGLNQMDSRPIGLRGIGCDELYQIKPYLLKAANLLSVYEESLSKSKSNHDQYMNSQR